MSVLSKVHGSSLTHLVATIELLVDGWYTLGVMSPDCLSVLSCLMGRVTKAPALETSKVLKTRHWFHKSHIATCTFDNIWCHATSFQQKPHIRSSPCCGNALCLGRRVKGKHHRKQQQQQQQQLKKLFKITSNHISTSRFKYKTSWRFGRYTTSKIKKNPMQPHRGCYPKSFSPILPSCGCTLGHQTTTSAKTSWLKQKTAKSSLRFWLIHLFAPKKTKLQSGRELKNGWYHDDTLMILWWFFWSPF